MLFKSTLVEMDLEALDANPTGHYVDDKRFEQGEEKPDQSTREEAKDHLLHSPGK